MALDSGAIETALDHAVAVYRRTARTLDPAQGYPRCTDDAKWHVTILTIPGDG